MNKIDAKTVLIEDPLTGEETVEPTLHLRWLGRNGTTTEPRRLQQLFYVTKHRRHTITEAKPEWRDIPLHLED